MHRKLRRIAGILCLLGAMLPAATLTATPTLAAATPCGQATGTNSLGRIRQQPSEEGINGSYRGIRANVWSEARIKPCTQPPLDATNGIRYWIGFVPASDNQYAGDLDAVMQIGVIECNGVPYDFASAAMCGSPNQNQKVIYYAVGGCGRVPIATTIRTAISGGVDFTVRRESGGAFSLDYAGSGIFGSIAISSTNPNTSCWASGTGDNVAYEMACKRYDGGDDCGNNSTGKVTFQTIRYQNTVGGAFHTPSGLSDADCEELFNFGICDVVGADKVQYWTS